MLLEDSSAFILLIEIIYHINSYYRLCRLRRLTSKRFLKVLFVKWHWFICNLLLLVDNSTRVDDDDISDDDSAGVDAGTDIYTSGEFSDSEKQDVEGLLYLLFTTKHSSPESLSTMLLPLNYSLTCRENLN